MSFFANSNTGICPGPICGSPIAGLCDRVCIQTNRVFDACSSQTQEEDLELVVTDQQPPNPTDPLEFISAASTGEPATITNLTIERFDENPCFARVTCDVSIPVDVVYEDADGIEGVGKSTINLSKDVVLHVPEDSIVPSTISAFGGCVCPKGEYIGNDTFIVDACIAVTLKVIVEAEILIPSYGYCPIPPCQEYTDEVCSGFFNLPLFPSSG